MRKGQKTAIIATCMIVFPILMGIGFRITKGTPQKAPKLKRYFAVIDGQLESDYTKKVNDTLWHIVPPFTFTDQDGKEVTEKTFADHIYVADFIFTSCPGICPRMTESMAKVQDLMMEKVDNIMFLTHTVDPETDTPKRFKRYAERFGADEKTWKFVTGAEKDLYDVCGKGYYLSCQAGSDGTEEFDHSGRLVLVDRDRIIRGFYVGYDEEAVNKLINDIFILQLEYEKEDRDFQYKVVEKPSV